MYDMIRKIYIFAITRSSLKRKNSISGYNNQSIIISQNKTNGHPQKPISLTINNLHFLHRKINNEINGNHQKRHLFKNTH